jgi:hypothetical protein
MEGNAQMGSSSKRSDAMHAGNAHGMELPRITGVASLALACLVLSGCLPATIKIYPKRTYKENTVGYYINDHFRNHVIGCDIIPPGDVRDWEEDFKARDLIPSSFTARYQRDLALEAHAYKVAGNTLWLYPFTATEITGEKPPSFAPDARRLLREKNSKVALVADDQGPIPQSQQGFNSFAHRESCSLYITTQASSGVEVPEASVRAGVKKEIDQHSNLVMVRAYFRSPLYDRFMSNSADALYAKMLLRERYLQLPELKGGYYLTQFPGTILYTSSVAHLSTDFNLDANAGTSVGVGDISLAMGVRYSDRSSNLADEYMTLVEDPPVGTRWADYFYPLPDSTEIQNSFATAVARAVPGFDEGRLRYLRQGAEHRHWHEIEGLPEGTCLAKWDLKVTPESQANFQPINGITTEWFPGEPGSEAEPMRLPRCRFTLKVIPKSTLFSPTGPSNVPIAYTITSVSSSTAPIPEDLKLSVSFEQMLLTTKDPQIIEPKNILFGTQPTSASTYVATWTPVIGFNDGNNPVDHDEARESQQSLTGVVMKCPEGERRVSVTLEHVPESRKYRIEVTSLDDLLLPVASAAESTRCTLQGTLTVPVKKTAAGALPTVSFPLNITLLTPPAPAPRFVPPQPIH